MRVLVTGASGRLGRHVVKALTDRGHIALAAGRNGPVRLDLATGDGLVAACDGVDAIVHSASSPFADTRRVDHDGTARLLAAAGDAHVIYPSIVGTDLVPTAYYRAKAAAEVLIATAGRHTIVRATQFHTFIDEILNAMSWSPILPCPRGFVFQPVDEIEVAEAIAACVDAPPAGRAPDLGGPEVLELGDLAHSWLGARRRRRLVAAVPAAGAVSRAIRSGALTVREGRKGQRTWAAWLAGAALLAGCNTERALEVGEFTVTLGDDGRFSALHATTAARLDDVTLHFAREADPTTEMAFGSFKFTGTTSTVQTGASFGANRARDGAPIVEVLDGDGGFLGTVTFGEADDRSLIVDWAPEQSAWVGFAAGCDAEEHVLGLGSHAFDVDHVGEAFSLWTSEPGVGKSDSDELPNAWFLEGARHGTSFPVPWALRTQQSAGILLDTTARVDVDLCATDPGRLTMAAWQDGPLRIVLIAGDTGMDAVRRLVAATGMPPLPQPWVFAPWNDAIRGPDRVREVAATLRTAGAPSSVIWTEDWKGAEDGPNGYHLTGEWTVDPTKYPDAAGLAAELERDGFKWYAYFSPFVTDGTDAWDDAVANDALIRDVTGEAYRFQGATFEDTSMVDFTSEAGRAWATGYMQAAIDVGFDGWMADYAEWLPTDAVLASGEDANDMHNAWPLLWQQLNVDVIGDQDVSFFARSGWTGSSGLAPVIWGGDQRTDFQVDDGFPTVIPLGLGLSACGVAVYTHDVAGYQSVGNPPGTKELFLRWAALGAYSPVLRTHHGAFAADNVQFDHDADTLAQWVWAARENMRLFPYRYGLAAQASRDGTPMVRPIGLQFPGEDVARIDAWMLGDALLVAPVVVEGAVSRAVDLPDAVAWYDWRTGEPAASGTIAAGPTEIPVFAAAGTTIPTFTTIPATLTEGADAELIDLADADRERTVYLIGDGGAFVEADGTSYAPTGAATGPGTVTQTVTAGTIEVAGVSLAIDGPIEREYTVVVVK